MCLDSELPQIFDQLQQGRAFHGVSACLSRLFDDECTHRCEVIFQEVARLQGSTSQPLGSLPPHLRTVDPDLLRPYSMRPCFDIIFKSGTQYVGASVFCSFLSNCVVGHL